MAGIQITLEMDGKQFTTTLNQATKATENFASNATKSLDKTASGMDKVSSTAEKVAGKMEQLSTILLGAAFVTFGQKTLDMADNIADLSKATDVSIGKILQLRDAFATNGGSAEGLGRIISKLSQTLLDARDGSAQAQEALLKLGLSFSDMANMNTEQAMTAVIDKLAGMTDASERNALAFKVFGKEAKMIDWEGIKAGTSSSTAEFQKMEQAIKNGAAAKDKLTTASENLQLAFLNLMNKSGFLDWLSSLSTNMEKFEKVVIVAGTAFALYFGYNAAKGVYALYEGIMKLEKGIIAIGVALKVLEQGNVFTKVLSVVVALTAAIGAYLGISAMLESAVNGDGTKTGSPGRSAEFAANDPRRIDQTKKPPVGAAWAKDVAALDQLSVAYGKVNDQILTKLNMDTKAIGIGEDQKQMMMALNDATIRYNDEITKLNQQIAAEQASPQSAARDAKIAQLKKEREEVAALFDIQLQKLPAAIKLQQQQQAIERDRVRNLNEQWKLESNLRAIQDEVNKFTLTDREKKYYDIRAQARNAAEDAINQEQMRLGKEIQISEARKEQIRSEFALRAEQQVLAQQGADQTARQFTTGWEAAYNQWIENSTNAATMANKAFTVLTSGMESALDKFVETGKLNFSDFARSVILDLTKIALKASAVNFIKSLGTTGVGGSLMSLMGFAEGGVIQTNKPVLVGEYGPELISGAAGMTVTPTNKLGGGNVSNTYITNNISAIDSKSVAQLFAENRTALFGSVEQARREMPMRTR